LGFSYPGVFEGVGGETWETRNDATAQRRNVGKRMERVGTDGKREEEYSLLPVPLFPVPLFPVPLFVASLRRCVVACFFLSVSA
jgi:hypothetical protein